MKPEVNLDITYLARTNFRGTDRMFGIKRKDRRQHMYVLGKSGTGKSTLLENMILQNVLNNEGLCVIDPHGELVEKIVASIPENRKQDVIYFNPSDVDFCIGFNVLQLDDPKYKHLVASGLMGIFTKIWANTWSSRMEYIMNNCILALLDTPGSTLMGIPRLLVDKDYRQYIIGNLKDPVVKAFWIHEYEAWRDQFRNEAIQPIQNKVGQFLSSGIVRNIVGQSKSTINIFDMMNNQKIFLVNLSKGRIGEDNSALLGGMLITKLQLAAMERVRIAEVDRKDFYLYVDEFQNFVTDSFASILSEARKYRLCLVLAHQYIAQLETSSGSAVKDAVFGNVGTMIVFRVGAEDGGALEGEFEPEFETEDFVNLPNFHVYMKLMVDGVTSRPFSARTLPPIEIHESEEMKQSIIDTSRKLYAISREQVERDIDRWSSSVPGASTPDGEEAAPGKFRAECWGDKKQIYVPFEPIEGRPIYCKDCMIKIKNGELTPAPGFRLPKDKNAQPAVSYDALSELGIEFSPQTQKNRRLDYPKSEFSTTMVTREVKKESINPVHNNPKPFIKPQVQPIFKKENGSIVGPNRKSLGDVIKDTIKPIIKPLERSTTQKNTENLSPRLSLSSLKNKKDQIGDVIQNSSKIATKESVSELKDVIARALEKKKIDAPPIISSSDISNKNTEDIVSFQPKINIDDETMTQNIIDTEIKQNENLKVNEQPIVFHEEDYRVPEDAIKKIFE